MPVTHVDRRAVLAQCRDTARLRLARVLAESGKAIEEELFQRADRARSGDDQQTFFEAMMCVRESASAFAFAFERAFIDQFEARLAAGPSGVAAAGDAAALSIVDASMLEEDLAAAALVRQSGYEIDAELAHALRIRLGEVLGEGPLAERRDPFAPEAVVGALRRAADAVTKNAAARRALAAAYRPYAARALAAVYKELNDILIARGVVPRIKRTLERSPDTGAQRVIGAGATGPMAVTQAMHAHGWLAQPTGPVPVHAPGAGGGPGAGAGGAPAGAETWSEALGRALASPPPVRRAVARMLADPDRYGFREALGTPASRALIRSLSELQAAPPLVTSSADFLASLDTSVREKSHPLDLLTVEFITTVFDHILEAPAIAETIKAQIARLQIVAVKAALLDRTFFARREHPMRQLLDRIAGAAADPGIDSRPGAPFVEALRQIVSAVIAEFRDDLGLFTRARERLDVIVSALAVARDDELSRTARALERAERAALAETTAHAEINRRVNPSTPAFVQAFLDEWWSRALAQGYADDLTGDDSWTHRLGVVDALVWSVGTLGRAEIRQLAKMLPTLMRKLVQGMTKIDVPEAARTRFFDELMRHHTAMIEGAKGATAAPFILAGPPPDLEAAVPPTPAPDPVEPPLDDGDFYAHAVRELARGTVVEFLDAEPPLRTKLAWVSPKHTVYLFTAGPTEARQFAPQALADALRRGQARILDASDALIDRIVSTVAGESGATVR